jgi:hypothetical protein
VTDRTAIDRTTDHMCPGLAADIAYRADYTGPGARSYYNCVNCERDFTEHYAQFGLLCRECRYECTEAADVADEACVYCAAIL